MEDGKHAEEQNEASRRWGVRHVQTFFLFTVMIISFGLRANISVSVVAMTDKSSANEDFTELSWDESTKGLVLSSFFWGYPLCQMFMGPLAQNYGAKYLLAGSMGICAVLTTITPLTAVYGGATAMCANQMLQGMLQSLPTPWIDIFKSMPIWSLIVAHFAQHWGFITLLTNVPNYMNSVLNFNIKSNAYWSALPYFFMFIMIIGIARITDCLSERGLMSKTMIRKMWNSLAFWGGALALLPLYFFDTSVAVALISLTVSMALNSGIYSGFFTNHLDISPNFAGTLIGITNSIGSLASILGPLFVGFVVTDSDDKDQWGIVFLCLATIFFIGNLFYVVFGSAEIQPWNDGSTNCAHEIRNDRGSLPINSLKPINK